MKETIISSFLKQHAEAGYCHKDIVAEGTLFRGLLEQLSAQTQNVFSIFDLKEFKYRYFTSNLYGMYGIRPQDGFDFGKALEASRAGYEGIAVFMNLMKESLLKHSPDEVSNCNITASGMPVVNTCGVKLKLFIHTVPLCSVENDEGYPRYWLSVLQDISAFIEEGYWLRAVVADRIYHQSYGDIQVHQKELITPSQLEILKCWMEHGDSKAIAAQLHISDATVRNQLVSIRSRFLARDNSAAVQLAIACGILSPRYKTI